MKSILIALLLTFSSSTFAQVVSVNVYQPAAGGAPIVTESFREARDIIQASGAQVAISSDLSGTYRFATIHDSWEAYGEWYAALQTNAAFGVFQAKTVSRAAATQTDNIRLRTVAAAAPGGGPGAVTQITVWELTNSNMARMLQAGRDSKVIHEKEGAAVSVYANGNNRMYYLQRYDSMAAWGKAQDTPASAEFNAYMQSLAAENNGDLGAVVVDSFTSVSL
jgi:hypothetical protein